MLKNLIFLFISLSIVSCVTKPPQLEGSDFRSARWKSEVLVIDQKTKKEQELKIVVIAERNNRARLEVSALLGYPVASIAIDSKQLKIAFHPRKIFYQGSAQSNMLERVLRVKLTGGELLSLLFNQPIQTGNWKCLNDDSNRPTDCKSIKAGTQIQWSYLNEGKKKVLIDSNRVTAEWNFETPQTNVEVKEALFQLEPPLGYKTIQIN